MIKPPSPGQSPPSPDDPESDASTSESKARASGRPDLGAAIGAGLKELFASISAEPVPEKLKQLLDELERKSGKR